jgi:hypothetical protein
MKMTRSQLQKEAMTFTKLLVEIANIYTVTEDGYIYNRDGFYLALVFSCIWNLIKTWYSIYKKTSGEILCR